MHELSFCQSILGCLQNELNSLTLKIKIEKVTKVELVIGKLHAVVPENLSLAWEFLTADLPILKGSILEIKFIPLALKCQDCGSETECANFYFICPFCQSPKVSTIRGEELYIEKIEIEFNGDGKTKFENL